MAVDEPEEDILLLRLSFRAWMFATRFHIPGYERWLETSGSLDRAVDFRRSHPELEDRWIERHKYDIPDYGLTSEAVDAAFARYREFVSRGGRAASIL